MVNFPVPTDIEVSDIRTRLKAIIVEQLGIEAHRVVDSASFSEDLDADSLEVVQIVMEIEEEFDLVVPDVDADRILTVGDAIRFIQQS